MKQLESVSRSGRCSNGFVPLAGGILGWTLGTPRDDDAAMSRAKVAVGIGDPGVLNAIIGAGLYGAVLGVFSLAVGAIVRHTAGAITGVIAFVLVLAPLPQLIPGSIGEHVFAYLPTSAGQLMVSARQGPDDLLSPWQGFGVMCLWTASLMILANHLLRRRDA